MDVDLDRRVSSSSSSDSLSDASLYEELEVFEEDGETGMILEPTNEVRINRMALKSTQESQFLGHSKSIISFWSHHLAQVHAGGRVVRTK